MNESNGATKTTNANGDAGSRLLGGDGGDPFANLCTPEDVNTVYKLLLGRLPDSMEVVVWYTQQTLSELVQKTISSVEFSNLIRDLEANPSYNPHSKLARDELKAAAKWFVARLGLSLPAGGGKGVEWRDLLVSFVSCWPAWKFFQDAFGTRSRAVFAQLAEREDRDRGEWHGQVDFATADEIRGWVFNTARTGIVRASFYANGFFIGMTECNLYRSDVHKDHGGTGICGFKFKPVVSDRILGGSSCTLTAFVTDTGEPLPLNTEFLNTRVAALTGLIGLHRQLAALSERIDELKAQLPSINGLTTMPLASYSLFCELFATPRPDLPAAGATLPKISVIVPIYKPPPMFLRAAIESVKCQSYPNWELILVNDAPDDHHTLEYLRRTAVDSNTIRVVEQETNTGLAGALNAGIAVATGDYISFLDHDDELDPNALAWCAHTILQTRAKFIYSDEDRVHFEGDKKVDRTPYFKPAFDYDLLLQRNYICHLACMSAETLRAAGGLRLGYEGAQDHELFIRLAEMLPRAEIVHIPLVLYHWNVNQSSYSMTETNIAAIEDRLQNLVVEHLQRTGQPATVAAHKDDFSPGIRFCRSVKWRESSPKKKLAIIIPTRDRVDYLAPCIESIRKNLSCSQRCELIILDNRSEQAVTKQYLRFLESTGNVKILGRDEDFNWSRLNNYAVRQTDAEHLLFMNNDMVVLSEGFDEQVCGLLDRRDVGVVGARLLYEDGTMQHAGVAIGVGGIAGHVGLGDPAGHGVYAEIANLDHNVGCVTGAFLGVSRATFESVKGFDEEALKIAFNDVDFCLKVRRIGKRIVYTPSITCYHYESVSRGYDSDDPVKAERANAEKLIVQRRWGTSLDYDLSYNGTFDRNFLPYTMIRMPTADYVSRYVEIQVEQAARDDQWTPYAVHPEQAVIGPDAVTVEIAARRQAAAQAFASS